MGTMTTAWVGYLSLIIFVLGYSLVVVEEKIHSWQKMEIGQQSNG